MESTTEDYRNVFRGYVTGRVTGSKERYQRKGGEGERGEEEVGNKNTCGVGNYCPYPPSSGIILSADLPDEIPPIDQDGLVISFECRPVFSNVMEIKISAHNTNTAPLQEVVMDLQVPTVSCKLSVTLEPQTFLRTVFVVN